MSNSNTSSKHDAYQPLLTAFAKASQAKYIPFILYGILSLSTMIPLFEHGYVLLLDITDMLEGPTDWENRFQGLLPGYSNRIPYYLSAGTLNTIFPQWVTQKIFWFLAIFVAGLGAHRLCPARSLPGKYFAGILYAVNPFVYTRLLAGQVLLVLSYALIPFTVYYFIRLLETGSTKNLILTVLFTTLITCFQIQMIFVLAIVLAVILGGKLIQKRHDLGYCRNLFKKLAFLVGGIFFLNCYWIIPFLTSSTSPLTSIGEADLSYFAPRDNTGLGVGFSVASLYGFWVEGYEYAKDTIPAWWLLFSFFLFFSLYGLICRFKDTQHGIYVKAIAIAGIVGLVLALGTSTGITKPLYTVLYDHFPFFKAMRDSHKFVTLICLFYAYLGGLGVDLLYTKLRKRITSKIKIVVNVTVIVLITPLVYSFAMFNGFSGQLTPTDYPEEWYQVNDYLNEDEDDFVTLFLPWHGYADYGWIPQSIQRIANPAQHVFDKPVIRGDNIEAGLIYTQTSNPISRYMDFLIENEDDISNFGELLAPLNVKYIIIVHEVDYEEYDFLYKQDDLAVDLDLPGITLFKNQHPTSKVYAVDSPIYINNLEEYLELSKTQDVMEHLYILGEGQTVSNKTKTQQLDLTEKCPVKYKVDGTENEYTIFTVSQNVNTEHWEYNGQQPVATNLGFMPIFESDPNGGEVVYTRFYNVYLPSYLVSGLTLLLMIWLYFGRRKPTLRLSKLPHINKRLFKRIFAR